MSRLLILTCFLAAGLITSAQTNPPKAKVPITTQKNPGTQVPATALVQTKKVGFTPELIQHLAPKNKVRGDDNLNGKTYVSVNMYYRFNRVAGDSVIKLILSVSGEEDEAERTSDARTLIKDEWEMIIYRAPEGYLVKDITGNVSAYFSFYADPARTGTALRVGECKGNFFSLRARTLGFEFDARIIEDIQFATQFSGPEYNPSPTFRGCQFEITRLKLHSMTITLEKK